MIVAILTEVEADSPRAHFVNVVKTAGGFARLGHRVLLFCRPPSAGAVEVAARFGEPDLELAMPEPGRLDARAFARWAAAEAQRRNAEFVYARTFCGAIASADAGLPTVMETHAHIGDPNPLLQAALEATSRPELPIAGLVTISRRLAAHYIERGAAPERVFVVPDGVDVELFRPPAGRSGVGSDPMGVGPTGRSVLYSGHLYDEKGIPTLIDAAPLVARRHPGARVHLLGGLPEDVERARTRAAETAPGLVLVHGPVPHAEVPRWLWHAGCLVLPPSANHPSASWTSPVKLGEYLAGGAPIVASDIPALRDWVDERTVRWFRPDDAADLAWAVGEALDEPAAQATARQAVAMELARRFSYPARAAAILLAGGVEAAMPAAA